MSLEFMDALKNRRSYYQLSDEKVVPEARIEEIVKDTLLCIPSSFNAQSTRIVLLFGEEHKKLWSITLDALREVMDGDRFPATQTKISESFLSGYGTILYFEDTSVVNGLSNKYPLYTAKFPVWSQHTNAMHQIAIWTALEAEGLGVSLQHYNPLMDEKIREEWNIPSDWQHIAQMPFGKPLDKPADKDLNGTDMHLKVFR